MLEQYDPVDDVSSEKDKMAAGESFYPFCPELQADYARAQQLLRALDATPVEAPEQRSALLQDLFLAIGQKSDVKPPFRCDYGFNIKLGDNVYINAGCTILDSGHVEIGNNVFIGPGVHIYAVGHPLDPESRRAWLLEPAPVTIGDDVWIGGGAILCPGVTIGAATVIGAGSVVTGDLPPGVLAVGNPCRVVRPIPSAASTRLGIARKSSANR